MTPKHKLGFGLCFFYVIFCTLSFQPLVIFCLNSEWVEVSPEPNAWSLNRIVSLFCFNGFSCMQSVILHSDNQMLFNFFKPFSLFYSCFYHSLFISPYLCPVLSHSAPPAPKRFHFLRSKSQDKLLPSPSRPPLSLARRLRFWSSTDIAADIFTSQSVSASGVF